MPPSVIDDQIFANHLNHVVMRTRTIIREALVFLVALLWIYTATWKFMELPASVNQLRHSPMVSGIAPLLAYGLPVLELALFGLLLFGKTRLVALYASVALLSLFTAYIIILLTYFQSEIPCICGGIISQLGWRGHIFFNLAFIAIGALAIWLNQDHKGTIRHKRHFQLAD